MDGTVRTYPGRRPEANDRCNWLEEGVSQPLPETDSPASAWARAATGCPPRLSARATADAHERGGMSAVDDERHGGCGEERGHGCEPGPERQLERGQRREHAQTDHQAELVAARQRRGARRRDRRQAVR